ncbi:hypothetical protein GQX74_009592 [Glossina fuscipes]|nr:hypothetical protein GQX74_009592 [Glossina fuscipes]
MSLGYHWKSIWWFFELLRTYPTRKLLTINGYHFDTVLLLSIFTGVFCLDRFYLGYYGAGLLKVSTLGGFFIGQLVDIILIAFQIVRPADGSYYIIPYYGSAVEIIRSVKKLVFDRKATRHLKVHKILILYVESSSCNIMESQMEN